MAWYEFLVAPPSAPNKPSPPLVKVRVESTSYFGAKQQHAYSPIIKHAHGHTSIDWGRIFIVATMLVFAVATNITINVKFPALAEHFPFIGVAVWVAIVLTIKIRRHDWELMPETIKGSIRARKEAGREVIEQFESGCFSIFFAFNTGVVPDNRAVALMSRTQDWMERFNRLGENERWEKRPD